VSPSPRTATERRSLRQVRRREIDETVESTVYRRLFVVVPIRSGPDWETWPSVSHVLPQHAASTTNLPHITVGRPFPTLAFRAVVDAAVHY
jgi:hypothetical protein